MKEPYRSDCWQISDELAGAISQVQKVVELTREEIGTSFVGRDPDGFSTGEFAFLYEPKAFLLVGSLREFVRAEYEEQTTFDQVSEQKFSSFELFRRSISNPEIITFDELLARARHIVQHPTVHPDVPSEEPSQQGGGAPDDDVPF